MGRLQSLGGQPLCTLLAAVAATPRSDGVRPLLREVARRAEEGALPEAEAQPLLHVASRLAAAAGLAPAPLPELCRALADREALVQAPGGVVCGCAPLKNRCKLNLSSPSEGARRARDGPQYKLRQS